MLRHKSKLPSFLYRMFFRCTNPRKYTACGQEAWIIVKDDSEVTCEECRKVK